MNEQSAITEAMIWEALETVPDPEIPVVSVVDLGIVQDVEMATDGAVTVKMTPTFAGCPAVGMMQEGMIDALHEIGVENVQVEVVLDPPWTTDRISQTARRKMQEFGIAPPQPLAGRGDGATIILMEAVNCPFCGSKDTRLENVFGPTLCRAMYHCDHCKQAFERFKPL